MPDFRLPDLGEGLTEAEVVTWHVRVGDTVTVDQPVVDVETAKATVEVPSPFAGVVGSLHAAVGDVVAVGAALITVVATDTGHTEDTSYTEDSSYTEDTGERDEITRAAGEEASGNVLIGYGTPATSVRSSRRHRRLRPSAAGPTAPGRAIAVSSPLVRKLAREAHVDVRSIEGTGPDGLVRRCDVTRAIAAAGPARTPPEPTTTPEPMTTPEPPEPIGSTDRTTRIPLTGIRRVTADKLSRSRREIPEATVWVDVDATDLLAARASMNRPSRSNQPPAEPISLTALVARFAVLGLRRFPELNARVEQDEIVLHADIHLGVATQATHGLVVPVIRNAQRLTTGELNDRIVDRTRAARARALTPADLSGGTFTFNNYGVFGVDGSAAIINHPEVAILGIGRVIPRPWVVDGRLEVRQVGQLTLAFDHRVCDGATAGGFLRYVADCVESPVTALRDL